MSRPPSFSRRVPTAGGGRALQSGAGGWWWWWRRSGCVLLRHSPVSSRGWEVTEYKYFAAFSAINTLAAFHFYSPTFCTRTSVFSTSHIWGGKKNTLVYYGSYCLKWSHLNYSVSVVQYKSGPYFGGSLSPDFPEC